ncbi:hypothetical protein GLOIN_2v1771596 [Rhizophagus clarus]|uniref:Uncharacterized protein n=1 Tax=Rhizophagus clarus TaxID=94130 RepID=A0A8H3QN14_9GLOM|nr:hypothetical protein GLOIN_2v1771596 [Rhizophagus clarus]
MSSFANTSTDPSFKEIEEYNTEQLITYLRTKISNLEENDFTILCDQSINGQAIVTMTQKEFSEPPFNFVYRKARNLDTLIARLNNQNKSIHNFSSALFRDY